MLGRPKATKCKWCNKRKKLLKTHECFECYDFNWSHSFQARIRTAWQRSFPNAYEWQMRKDKKIRSIVNVQR